MEKHSLIVHAAGSPSHSEPKELPPVGSTTAHSFLTRKQYTFPDSTRPGHHILSLLPSEPPKAELAISTTSRLPPTPDSFTENPRFLHILQEVVSEHATEDPEVKSQAQVMVSTAGANLGSGGLFFPQSTRQPKPPRRPGFGGGGATGGDSVGGASGQGGAGSGGRGGWIHVSDGRRPPEYGRIAWSVQQGRRKKKGGVKNNS